MSRYIGRIRRRSKVRHMSRGKWAIANRVGPAAAIPVHVPVMERIALSQRSAPLTPATAPSLQPSESDKPEPHQLYTNQQRVSIASAIAKHLPTPHPSKPPPSLLPARLLRRPPAWTPKRQTPRDHHALRASTTTSQPASLRAWLCRPRQEAIHHHPRCLCLPFTVRLPRMTAVPAE